jgi:PAS domain S-box-containing protein
MDVMMGFDSTDRGLDVLEKLVYPPDLPAFLSKLEISMKTGRDFFHVYRISHLKNGKLKWISGRGRMIKDKNREVIKMIGTVQDITEQKSIEQKVRRLTDRILLATEIAGIGVWEYDREKDEIFWEEQMYTIFSDRSKPISEYSEMLAMLHEKDKDVLEDAIQKVKEGINFLEIECRIYVKDELKYLRSFTRVLRDQNGMLNGMIGVFYDITLDKKLQLELETSLDEKNILIKEVHHRVKNNMQLVSSILALKSYELKDEKSKEIFTEVNDRIKAMSIIHDKLYTFYNVSEINIAEYVNSIAEELRILIGSEQININVSADEIIFDVDRALTIGLIISELVSNAFKHGFKKINTGTIDISILKKGDNYSLSVHNDGEPIPTEALKSTSGLGMSLIQTFVRQLLGTITLDSRNGFRVDF